MWWIWILTASTFDGQLNRSLATLIEAFRRAFKVLYSFISAPSSNDAARRASISAHTFRSSGICSMSYSNAPTFIAQRASLLAACLGMLGLAPKKIVNIKEVSMFSVYGHDTPCNEVVQPSKSFHNCVPLCSGYSPIFRRPHKGSGKKTNWLVTLFFYGASSVLLRYMTQNRGPMGFRGVCE